MQTRNTDLPAVSLSSARGKQANMLMIGWPGDRVEDLEYSSWREEMGDAFRAVFWLAGLKGTGEEGKVEGMVLTSCARGFSITSPKEAKLDGVSGCGIMVDGGMRDYN